MRYTWMDEFLLSKTGVTKDLQAEWNWIRYHIGGKMFAAICLDDKNVPYYITLKLDPTEGDFLRTQYEDIIPGYYMNKVHWNSINPDGAVSDDLLKDLLDKSYQLVLGSFSKKKQKELLQAPESRCGLLCSECEYRTQMNCAGCVHIAQPFWGESCPIKSCCEGKGLAHCGTCDTFPCDLLHQFSYDKEQGDDGKRIAQCQKWCV